MKRFINTPSVPAPGKFLSQAARIGGLVQVSGQGGNRVSDQGAYLSTVEDQTEQALLNIETVLRTDGLTFDDVLMFRVYLADRSSWDAMNSAYEAMIRGRMSGDDLPARTTVIVGLPFEEMHVEIDALAVAGEWRGVR